jgi:hypothetical protein
MPKVNHEKNEAARQEDADGDEIQAGADIDESRVAIPAAMGAIGFIARKPRGAMAERTGRCNHIKW